MPEPWEKPSADLEVHFDLTKQCSVVVSLYEIPRDELTTAIDGVRVQLMALAATMQPPRTQRKRRTSASQAKATEVTSGGVPDV